jgi:hypothetical protein
MPRDANRTLVMLKILHRSLVSFRGASGFEGAKIAALAGLGLFLARIEPVFAGFYLADHYGLRSPGHMHPERELLPSFMEFRENEIGYLR